MSTKNLIERINYLAKKSKTVGLTKEELDEQQTLRSEYIKNFRNAFKKQITNLTVIDPEGNDVTPEKVKKIKQQRNKYH